MADKIIERFPSGIITPPPSKSLCHRAIICAALCPDGAESVITNIGLSNDIEATLSGMSALGAGHRLEGNSLRVYGAGASPEQLIDCRESGTTLRFLMPIAALSDREYTFTGAKRLLERPLDAYERLFNGHGAYFGRKNGAVTVRGPLKSGVYQLTGDVSSQYVSALLLSLPMLEGESEIRLTTPLESSRYVDLTLDVMTRFGVFIERRGNSMFSIKGNQCYKPANYSIEADYSQAAFWLAAAALGRDVTVAGLNPQSLQGDMEILGVLGAMGAEILDTPDGLRVRVENLTAVTVDAREIPDLIPPIAALCCFCEGESRIINAGRLRYKESDRLSAVAQELKNLGAKIAEQGDALVITGDRMLPGGRVDSHNDHRIAMAMAVAAIRCINPVELTGWESVKKSYPGFWNDFEAQTRGGGING